MSPEQALRAYFHAKDENRPHLAADLFSEDARLQITNRSDQISFPAVTTGPDDIIDVLVRRFNQSYENIYSFYLGRPAVSDATFSCDWLVGMTDKASRSARVGCGRYDWQFERTPQVRVRNLAITIEVMLVLPPHTTSAVLGWLARLDYPWESARSIVRGLPLAELEPVGHYLNREGRAG
jgi:hypothetical protein